MKLQAKTKMVGEKINHEIPKSKKILIVILSFVLVIFLIGLIYFSDLALTGKAVLSVATIYNPNETLQGTMSLSLKPGELIPADSSVLISIGDKVYEYKLSELVDDSVLEGDFYTEGNLLSGTGNGYGIRGEKTIYPDVKFSFRVLKSGEISEETTEETTAGEEAETTEGTTTEEATTETTTEGTTETTTEEATTETTTEGTTETTTEETEITGSVVEEEAETTTEEATIETPPEETTTEEATGVSLITGGAVAGSIEEITGITSKNNPYTYKISQEESAELISSEQEVDLNVDNNVVVVTTDYAEIENGFGEDYIGDELKYTLTIDLSSLDIEAKEGKMVVSVVYQEEEIISLSTDLEIESPEQVVQPQIPLISENIEDYALDDLQISVLRSQTGSDRAEITKAEVVDGRLIIRFEIGDYWQENSYDNTRSEENLNIEIELDRAKFLKRVSNSLLEAESERQEVEKYIGAENLVKPEETTETTTEEVIEGTPAEEETTEEIEEITGG